MPAPRARLDSELVRRGLAATRSDAQRLISSGRVAVGGSLTGKASTLVARDQALSVAPAERAYASRGGHKLAGGLDDLGVAVADRSCLDAGASNGGFTDVLLRRGAARVVAVDVGYGQLAWRLQTDDRVVVLDRTNVRHLTPADVPPPAPDLVVADLSFISLGRVLPALRAVADPEADHLLLVKPQFEAGPSGVGRGGVVRAPGVWADTVRAVVDAAAELGLGPVGVAPSRLRGPAGNVEFFLHLRAGGAADHEQAIAAAVAAIPEPGPGGRR